MGTLVGGGRTSPPAPTPDCAQEIAGTEAPTAPPERYWPELDGLRAIAVLLVIGYHVDGNVLPGGLFGVDVFFTLSGFLITTVLLEEYARRGRFDLRRFYFRRVLRLYPAMLFMLLGAVALGALIGGPYGWHLTITDVPLAMTYTLNWVAGAAHGLSLVTHLWSLCVEEQFYLIWPLVMLVALRRGPRTALAVACTIAVVAAALTPVLYQLGGTDRVYHGTDARAPELLVGAIAALLIFIRPPAPSVRRLLTVGAVGAVGVVVVAVRGRYRTSSSTPEATASSRSQSPRWSCISSTHRPGSSRWCSHRNPR